MRRKNRFPCTIMRGGTSKGIFLREKDLPPDPVLRDQIILAIFGSPDNRQIDGLGGADSLTSKLALLTPARGADRDIDYTFGAVGIEKAFVDYSANCGNISAAVGPYAIDKGFVKAVEPFTIVRIYNTNTKKGRKVRRHHRGCRQPHRVCPGRGAESPGERTSRRVRSGYNDTGETGGHPTEDR